jgi:hypothetical protein
MISKNNKIFYTDNIRLLLLIDFFDATEYFDLDESLFGEFRLIFYNFEGYLFFIFVIVSFEHLPIWTLSNYRQDLVPKSDVVVLDVFVLFPLLQSRYS